MAEIFLHNTLTGKKELFKPLKRPFLGLCKPRVGMYHCGPTVYNYIHIGNLRAFFLADILRRMFEANGYDVKQVMNITDIGLLESDNAEDKMTVALKREGKPLTLKAMRELADFYTKAFVSDLEALNVQMPHKLPKASEHIAEDIAIVKKLEKKGLTYRIPDGIYFDTSKAPDYGRLGQVPDLANEKSRIGMNSDKRNPRDFALWKFNQSLGWDSPWGKGFPGWHIECSAMSMKYLGETFDIHTGGIDLIPIHHNNEIAQSEHATGHPFARYWVHNAFVNIGEAKMAKSAGNYLSLGTLVEKGYSPMAYRYLLLGARYSSPLNFSFEALDAASAALKRLGSHMQELAVSGNTAHRPGRINRDLYNKALGFVSDDLDTPKALALCWDIVKDAGISPADKFATILAICDFLGLNKSPDADAPVASKMAQTPVEIQKLADERKLARDSRDWKRSDELRDQIVASGYDIKDTPQGPQITKR